MKDNRIEMFEINDYMTLKLEDNKSVIYIKGEKFINCMRLIVHIPINDTVSYDEINSIDEASEKFKTLYNNRIQEGSLEPHSITPEQEFWGHASNLQVWCENDYDTRLLHSNLSFPLLKKLSEAGDSKAKAFFKDEIAKRFSSHYEPTVYYLFREKYLDFLEDNEFQALMRLENDSRENWENFFLKWYACFYRLSSKKHANPWLKNKIASFFDVVQEKGLSELSERNIYDLVKIANQYKCHDDPDSSIHLLKMVIQEDPDDFVAWSLLANSYIQSRDFFLAMKTFNDIKAQFGDSYSTVIRDIAKFYMNMGEFKKSILAFTTIVQNNGQDHPRALLYLERTNNQIGDHESVIGYRLPCNFFNYDFFDYNSDIKIKLKLELGKAYYQLNDLENAVAILEPLSKQKPYDIPILHALAHVYLKQGEHELARLAFKWVCYVSKIPNEDRLDFVLLDANYQVIKCCIALGINSKAFNIYTTPSSNLQGRFSKSVSWKEFGQIVLKYYDYPNTILAEYYRQLPPVNKRYLEIPLNEVILLKLGELDSTNSESYRKADQYMDFRVLYMEASKRIMSLPIKKKHRNTLLDDDYCLWSVFCSRRALSLDFRRHLFPLKPLYLFNFEHASIRVIQSLDYLNLKLNITEVLQESLQYIKECVEQKLCVICHEKIKHHSIKDWIEHIFDERKEIFTSKRGSRFFHIITAEFCQFHIYKRKKKVKIFFDLEISNEHRAEISTELYKLKKRGVIKKISVANIKLDQELFNIDNS